MVALALVVPTLFLWANGHEILAGGVILLARVVGFAAGVVSRYWKNKLDTQLACGITTGDSAITRRRKSDHESFLRNMSQTAFAIPLWVVYLSRNPESLLTLLLLWPLVFTECASLCLCMERHFSAPALPAPAELRAEGTTVGFEQLQRAKHSLVMLANAVLVLGMSYAALLLLAAASRKLAPRASPRGSGCPSLRITLPS